MTTLKLQLLGEFRAFDGDTPLDGFATDKARALLGFLAAEADRPHTRMHLATLLWGEWDDGAARSNLRKTLFRLRQTLGSRADWLLSTSRSSVQLNSSAADIDLLQFNLLSAAETTAELARAAALYGGDLLAGLSLPDAPAFDEWLAVRREQLHQQALTLLGRLGERHLAGGNLEEAQETALRRLSLTPWHEPAHRQLMRIYAAGNRRAEALAQYDRCRAILAAELGVAPDAATERLAAELRQAGQPDERLHYFPASHTPFFGRESASEQLVTRLHDPRVRLVTITGPGGVGKTRLAIEATRHGLGAGSGRRAYFIDLSTVRSGTFFWQTLGERLQVTPGPRGLTAGDVLEALREQRILLLLDNYEQLLPDVAPVTRILDAAPGVDLLVTSRAPLNLRAEWRLPLAGLDTPEGTGSLEESSAAVLLLSAGRQARPDLAPTADDAEAIAHICRRLGGMPLALEIAGSWLGLLTPQALAEQIDANIDFLVATRNDLPARHRSLRAIFDHARERLSPAAQRLLQDLACFQGSFDLPAVLSITDATLPTLNLLADHVLVQRSAAHRYVLHPVLRAFLEEDGVADDMARRHAAYYLNKVAAGQAHAASMAQTVAAIGDDLANVRAAWEWGVARRETALLARALRGMLAFYEYRGAYDEGRRQFAAAAAALPAIPLRNRLLLAEATCSEKLGQLDAAVASVREAVADVHGETQLTALVTLGLLYERQGAFDEALAALAQALPLAETDSAEAARILNIRGKVDRFRGALPESIAAHEAALRINQMLGDEIQGAESHANLALSHRDLADYAQAFDHIREALAIVRRLNHREFTGRFTFDLGSIHWQQDDLDAAERCFAAALTIANELNHQRDIANCRNALGVIAARRFQHETALDHYRTALGLAERLGDGALQALMLGNSGNTLRNLGRYDEAIDHYERALALAEAAGTRSGTARHLGNIGDTLMIDGAYERALDYFQRALPLLRESQARYYLCWVLISTGHCLLALGRLAEAREAVDEGTALAEAIERRPYVFTGRLLSARLDAAGGDREGALTRLRAMAAAETDPRNQGEIAYTIWQISGAEADRDAVEARFAALYATYRLAIYRDRLSGPPA